MRISSPCERGVSDYNISWESKVTAVQYIKLAT